MASDNRISLCLLCISNGRYQMLFLCGIAVIILVSSNPWLSYGESESLNSFPTKSLEYYRIALLVAVSLCSPALIDILFDRVNSSVVYQRGYLLRTAILIFFIFPNIIAVIIVAEDGTFETVITINYAQLMLITTGIFTLLTDFESNSLRIDILKISLCNILLAILFSSFSLLCRQHNIVVVFGGISIFFSVGGIFCLSFAALNFKREYLNLSKEQVRKHCGDIFVQIGCFVALLFLSCGTLGVSCSTIFYLPRVYIAGALSCVTSFGALLVQSVEGRAARTIAYHLQVRDERRVRLNDHPNNANWIGNMMKYGICR